MNQAKSVEKAFILHILPYIIVLSIAITAFYIPLAGTILLECPKCHDMFVYRKPNISVIGTSTGETFLCPYCEEELFIITYYDGEVVVVKR